MGFGKEKVVNGLKTLKRNFKDGLDKETQEWRRMNENHITKLNRRDVLKLMAIGAAGEALLAACAHPVIQAVGALTRTPEVKPSTTPTSETLGIQYGEVKVLDREGLRAKDATISTQVTALEAELKKRRPELFTAETQVDQLAILVPEKTMSGKTNFIYPFITVRNPESTKSFVAMVLVSPDGKGIVAQSLIPQDVSIDGMQKGALVLPTGSEMLSIFVFPRTVAEWSAMSDAEKLDSIIDFIPPQKGNVKIPLNGGKLASPAIWNMNIGYSSPNLTEIPPTPAPTATNAPTETATQAPTATSTPRPANTQAPTADRPLPTSTPKPTEVQNALPADWPGKSLGWPIGTVDQGNGLMMYVGTQKLDSSFDSPGYVIVTDCRNIDPSKGCPKVGGSLNSVEAALYTIPGYVDKVKNGDIEFKYFGNNAYKGTVHGTTVVYVRILK